MPTFPTNASHVHLVRHGEVYNPEGVLYGRLPGYHLSDNGRAMAERLGEYFAKFPVRLLRSSPLERAQETMKPISAHHDIEVHLDERFIEADNELAGQVFGPRNKAIFNPKNWKYFTNPTVPSWGEPYADIAERMKRGISAAAAELSAGEDAVVVSHQLPIWIARLSAEGKKLPHDPRKRQCIVGSVTSFRYVDGDLVGVTYAEPARDLLRGKANSAFSSGR